MNDRLVWIDCEMTGLDIERDAGKGLGEPDVCVRNVRKAVILLG